MITKEIVDNVDYYVWDYLNNKRINFVSKKEITQNVLIKIWRNFDKFDRNRPIKPWLKAICHNESKNYIRDFCAKNKKENSWSIQNFILFAPENRDSIEGELAMKLSPREFLVYCGLIAGKSVKEIGKDAHLCIQTIYKTKNKIKKKYIELL